MRWYTDNIAFFVYLEVLVSNVTFTFLRAEYKSFHDLASEMGESSFFDMKSILGTQKAKTSQSSCQMRLEKLYD